ncbi:MAG: HAD-IB family hydrolase [Candidatus Zixiibacteriota bacterium]|nr:MAG: HAD-IB family hydrolase [candidate division Zixibacteria bacterium]
MENPRLVVFDIDGTLLPGTSCERMFFKHLVKQKIVGFRNFVNFAVRGIALAPKGKTYIIKANKGYLRGFSPEYMNNIGMEFFKSDIINRISKKGIIRLTEHKNKGDKVVLLSGMPEFLLRNFAEFLGVSEYYGSVMEVNNKKFTGKTIGVFPLAQGKVKIIETGLRQHDLKWGDVTIYADHYLDRFLLQKAGEPTAVNPDDRLKAVAESNNWPIEYFDI